jgi:hypothetical protein
MRPQSDSHDRQNGTIAINQEVVVSPVDAPRDEAPTPQRYAQQIPDRKDEQLT